MCIILNIGLIANEQALSLEWVKEAVRQGLAHNPAWGITTTRVVQSDSEPTLVVVIEKTYLWNAYSFRTLRGIVRELSDFLSQDCIALWDGYEAKGLLTGSNADKWVAFSAEYFFLQDGTRLGDLV